MKVGAVYIQLIYKLITLWLRVEPLNVPGTFGFHCSFFLQFHPTPSTSPGLHHASGDNISVVLSYSYSTP